MQRVSLNKLVRTSSALCRRSIAYIRLRLDIFRLARPFCAGYARVHAVISSTDTRTHLHISAYKERGVEYSCLVVDSQSIAWHEVVDGSLPYGKIYEPYSHFLLPSSGRVVRVRRTQPAVALRDLVGVKAYHRGSSTMAPVADRIGNTGNGRCINDLLPENLDMIVNRASK